MSAEPSGGSDGRFAIGVVEELEDFNANAHGGLEGKAEVGKLKAVNTR
jgi:hypothetical protein